MISVLCSMHIVLLITYFGPNLHVLSSLVLPLLWQPSSYHLFLVVDHPYNLALGDMLYFIICQCLCFFMPYLQTSPVISFIPFADSFCCSQCLYSLMSFHSSLIFLLSERISRNWFILHWCKRRILFSFNRFIFKISESTHSYDFLLHLAETTEKWSEDTSRLLK